MIKDSKIMSQKLRNDKNSKVVRRKIRHNCQKNFIIELWCCNSFVIFFPFLSEIHIISTWYAVNRINMQIRVWSLIWVTCYVSLKWIKLSLCVTVTVSDRYISKKYVGVSRSTQHPVLHTVWTYNSISCNPKNHC